MKYFNIKSIILGIGIGFIISAISGSINFSFIDKKEPMSKEEIINKAKAYGMIEASTLIKEDEKPTPTIMPTPVSIPNITQTPARTLGPTVSVRVESGDTAVQVAKKLYDSKLINDQDSFVKKMVESGVAYKMIAKEHNFNLGMTEEEIMNTLTKRGY